MYKVTDQAGNIEQFPTYDALGKHLLETATDEYTEAVMDWAHSEEREPLVMLNGSDVETWEFSWDEDDFTKADQ